MSIFFLLVVIYFLSTCTQLQQLKMAGLCMRQTHNSIHPTPTPAPDCGTHLRTQSKADVMRLMHMKVKNPKRLHTRLYSCSMYVNIGLFKHRGVLNPWYGKLRHGKIVVYNWQQHGIRGLLVVQQAKQLISVVVVHGLRILIENPPASLPPSLSHTHTLSHSLSLFHILSLFFLESNGTQYVVLRKALLLMQQKQMYGSQQQYGTYIAVGILGLFVAVLIGIRSHVDISFRRKRKRTNKAASVFLKRKQILHNRFVYAFIPIHYSIL